MTTDPLELSQSSAPEAHNNPPGLSALAYRQGTHATVFQRLLARLGQQEILDAQSGIAKRPLQMLSTGDRSDPAIALLDAWATVADVLSFYQERIANEGYLGTAIEDRSVLELARTLGYNWRPGVAATTPLVFTVEDAPGSEPAVLVPQGTKAQSIPTQPGELPQPFETTADLLARVEWNVLTPHLQQEFVPATIDANATSLTLQGTSTQLQPGDRILIVGKERLESPTIDHWLVRSLTTVTPYPQAGYTKIGWGDESWVTLPTHPQIFALRQRAALFGHNAPPTQNLTIEGEGTIACAANLATVTGTGTVFLRQLAVGDILLAGNQVRRIVAIPEDGSLTVDPAFATRVPDGTPFSAIRPGATNFTPTLSGTQIDLDAVYPKLLPQSWILLSQPDPIRLKTKLLKVQQTATVFHSAGGLSGQITQLKVDVALAPNEFDRRQSSVFIQSEPLNLVQTSETTPPIQTIDNKTTIILDRTIPHPKTGQLIIISGNGVKPPSSEVVPSREVATVENAADHDGHTVLTIQNNLTTTYEPSTLKIYGNVVQATHGETITDEVLGSGDGSQTNQQFSLKKSPLTYISTATATGAQSTLKVYVNQVLWHPVNSLHAQDAGSQCYVVQLDAAGQTQIIFGDGIQGARLPSGQENVRATYRSGLGQVGEVKAGSLILLQNRPLGIREVTNPLPAGGAADRDTAALTRKNAPRTVLTLDHVVSLRDFENFARSFAGIGKAQATQIWTGDRRQIYITVADANGETAPAALCETLQAAIAAAGNGLQPVQVQSFNPEEGVFGLAAKVLIDSRYRFDQVKPRIHQTLAQAFSFTARDFGQGVAAAEVIQIIQGVEGVVAIDLDAFYLASQYDPENSPNPPLESFLTAQVARWDSAAGQAQPAQILLLDDAASVALEEWR
jgi:predicted phage baseplate assembly protein